MNSTVAVLATGLLSLTAGALGGYFFAKHQLTEKFEEDLSAESAELRNKYYDIGVERETDVKDRLNDIKEAQEYLDDLTTYIQKKYDIDDVYEEIRKDKAGSDQPEKVEKFAQYRNYTEYHKLTDSYSEPVAGSKESEAVVEDGEDDIQDEPVKEEEVNEVDFEYPEDQYQKAPYFIPQDAFMANEFDYEQTTMEYFLEDNILLDEQDHVFDEPEFIFGNLLKGLTKDSDTLYFVRNNGIEMEIELHVNMTSLRDVDARIKRGG